MDEDQLKVKIIISACMVKPGHWNSDADAKYAIAMDADNGEIVWYASNDWRTYGMHNGWTRVAKIIK